VQRKSKFVARFRIQDESVCSWGDLRLITATCLSAVDFGPPVSVSLIICTDPDQAPGLDPSINEHKNYEKLLSK
jgi:hypothetical protein